SVVRSALAQRKKLSKLWRGSDTSPLHVRYEISFEIVDDAIEVSHEFLFLVRDTDWLSKHRPEQLLGDWALDHKDHVLPILRRAQSEFIELWPENAGEDKSISFQIRPEGVGMAGLPLDPHRFAAAHSFKSFLSNDALAYRPNLSALRQAQPSPGRTRLLRTDATTLPWIALDLSREEFHFKEWIMHIQSAIPRLSHIEPYLREDDRFAYLKLYYGNDAFVPPSGLSDGTMSILAYTILPYVEPPPRFLNIEEPENGIHPKAIETVLESLHSMRNSQVWATTHSPIVVAVTPLD